MQKMILSFHPLFEADQNILCAGRPPDDGDLAAIKAAKAVILSQGCSQKLYEMARENCKRVFPNYDVRFKYPGKTGQALLFRELNAPHPQSFVFADVDEFMQEHGDGTDRLPLKLPFVFKFDWGGEGDTVYLIDSRAALRDVLKNAIACEKSGQKGFLTQEYIPGQNRTLRVVVMGQKKTSYWRVQANSDSFQANLSKGAVIETEGDPDLQQLGIGAVETVCRQTGIDLAGFDVIFSHGSIANRRALLLEINYFFGRTGLGGSEAYYKMLQTEISNWLNKQRL